MIQRNCEHCGKEFQAKNDKVKRGAGRFCSQPCNKQFRWQRLLKEPWVNEAVSQYKAGKGFKLIAKEMGLKPSNVRSVLLRIGVFDSKRALGIDGVPHNKGLKSAKKHSVAFYQFKAFCIEWHGVVEDYTPRAKCVSNAVAAIKARNKYTEMPIEKRRERNRKMAERQKADPKHKEKKRAWRLVYMKDAGRRMRKSLSSRLSQLMRGKNGQSIIEFVGCDEAFLRRHIQSQFKRGMNWNNYGKWEVDHIQPCALFDHTDKRQVLECWNWQNLKPLWRADNRMKSDSIVDPQSPLPLSFLGGSR